VEPTNTGIKIILQILGERLILVLLEVCMHPTPAEVEVQEVPLELSIVVTYPLILFDNKHFQII
jgi:hypothetical protein